MRALRRLVPLIAVAVVAAEVPVAAIGDGPTNNAALDPVRWLHRLDDRPADRLDHAIARARTVTRMQIEAAGGPGPTPVPGAGHDRPSEAVKALAARYDPGPDAPDGEVSKLDRLPAPVRGQLADVVAAFSTFDDRTRAAYQDRPTDGEVASLLQARTRLLDAVADLDATVPATPSWTGPAPSAIDLCPAVALDLAGDDSTYVDDCALIVDLGGNDTYHNNAGGSGLDTFGDPCGVPLARTAAALVDLGSGDDAYGDPGDPRACGANGGGFFASGFLVDDGGRDVYHASRKGTNGGADFDGTGLLVDAGGDDIYKATRSGTNGGVEFGAHGLLVDAGGADRYNATDRGTNGGGYWASGGTGFLVDLAGDDDYLAGTHGTNGGVEPAPLIFVPQQGIGGLLLDRSGQDRYRDALVDCDDCTHVPKGLVGAQVDSDDPPGSPGAGAR